MLGSLYVTDTQFIDRMTTIVKSEETRDNSAQGRLDLWRAGVKMTLDHPLGIGVGNWYNKIGHYIPESKMDAHSTYVKCIAELGVHGFFLFVLIILAAYSSLSIRDMNVLTQEEYDDMALIGYAMKTSLVILLACSVTITILYQDYFWILLCLPICLKRAVENAESDNLLVRHPLKLVKVDKLKKIKK